MDGETSSFSYFKGSCALFSHVHLFLALVTWRCENYMLKSKQNFRHLNPNSVFSFYESLLHVSVSNGTQRGFYQQLTPVTSPHAKPCPMLAHHLLVRMEAPSSVLFLTHFRLYTANAGERPCHTPLLVSNEVENTGGMEKEGSGKTGAAEDELQGEGGLSGWVSLSVSPPEVCRRGFALVHMLNRFGYVSVDAWRKIKSSSGLKPSYQLSGT